MEEMRNCLGCGISFAPKSKRHVYHSTQCRYRMRQQMLRLQRKLAGLCPQCGGEMDYPTSTHRTKNKITYCSKCREYFRIRHSAGGQNKLVAATVIPD